jgi:hypothetical protein
MKHAFFLPVLILLVSIAVPFASQTALADTQLYCNEAGAKDTECNYTYSLGQLATKKFNGRCTAESYKVTKATCTAGKSPMTCTITATCGDNCSTCSCTNWATGKRINAYVKVTCQYVN